MCGIVAFLSKQEPISEEVLKRATRSLYQLGLALAQTKQVSTNMVRNQRN